MNRRIFLQRSAAIAGMMMVKTGFSRCLNVGETEPSKKPVSFQLACSSINYSSLALPDACERIAKLGYPGIDIWSGQAGCPHLDSVLEKFGSDGLAEMLTQNKLKLCSFSTYAGGYGKYAELLGKCGGGLAVQGSTGWNTDRSLTRQMKSFLESQKPLLELCEKYNSALAVENHSGATLLDSLDSIKAFVDQNRNPRLGIALAPYHILHNGESVSEAIRLCGSQLKFIYLWENGEGARQMPGVGSVDMQDWIEALRDIQYPGYGVPFMHGEPEPDEMDRLHRRSIDYLTKWMK
ncbi:MAG: sugar phosphate isomerase/epimerase family protein [Thermoguttaceae bacterium]